MSLITTSLFGLLLSATGFKFPPDVYLPPTADQLNTTEKVFGCSSITDPDECVKKTEAFVHVCTYCTIDQECHDVGSLYNVCPNYCCASQSSVSTCDFHTPEEIDIPFDGYCSVPGNYTNTTAYDHDEAVKMLHYAGAAYCADDHIKSWSCDPHCTDVPSFAPKLVIQNSKLNLQAFIGYDNDANTIILSFRGTVGTSITNWINDLTFTQIAPFPDYPTVKVHKGFFDMYLALKPEILDEISTMPKVPIQITGHSLGAALASVAAFDLGYTEKIELGAMYNFGSPRVGNYDWSEIHRYVVPNHWRVTHNKDLVVHVPAMQMNFYHNIIEVFYPGDPPTHQVCNGSGEDIECANRCARSLACTSVSDHLHYMGFSLGTGC